ncbi:Flagellar biosynthetic protein FliQ (plasmid) [Rhodovastum atsumiense]|uniref:flagellar biosynthetic protein FliQ n=1 Tax=Rhodovastum atsumiense TaxID=504468 RepID=UPI002024AC9A|nr:flagellar biosynthetic protein FliQ [Rhodovastum atsumiense]CAH2605431.1 Flagellar biosynthetic protein FliQ [Rhodovastum atsumiense]
MNEGDVVEVLRGGFYAVLMVSGPALLAALVTGVGVGLLQALTQVQEMTLANIPKIAATMIAIMLFLPLSFATLRGFMEQIVQLIVGI